MDFTSNKFDQFGNYIAGSDSESEETTEDEQQPEIHEPTEPDVIKSVLPEDKEYYPEAREVYPEYTKIKHEDEDREEYTTPIIEPKQKRSVANDIKTRPETTYNAEFMKALFENQRSIRNIAFVGALGHGKTELVDCLVSETHPNILEKMIIGKDVTNQILGEGRRIDRLRWTDRLFLEKRRELSISTEVMSLVHETTNGEMVALNLIDTPGHPDFMDQVEVGLSMADGIVFCIDVVEGLTKVSTRLLIRCIGTGLPIILCLTKIDRLILELKVPPDFSHLKMCYIIEEFNTCLRQNQYPHRIAPDEFNVVFTSAQFMLCFTLDSIGLMYGTSSPDISLKMKSNARSQDQFKLTHRPSAKEISLRLWGDYRLTQDGREILSSTSNEMEHPFVKFVLEPIYKVFTHVLSYEPQDWSRLLHVELSSAEKKMNTAPLLRIALSRIFGSFSSFVQVVYDKLPSPIDRVIINENKTQASIVALAAKFVPSYNGEKITSLVRIFKGTIEEGMSIYCLSKAFAEDRSVDPTIEIGQISIPHVRYSTNITRATPGMIIRIESSKPEIRGISTLTDVLEFPLPPVILPIPLMKVAIEPLIPDKHPDMVQSVSKAQLCYPSLQVKVEVTGEHTLIGTGELFLDCVMHDIRNSFETMEIKVSDPFAVFNETVSRQSSTICKAIIDDDNSIGIICEPINSQTLDELEVGKLAHASDLPKALGKLGWDEIARQSVWCFGPDQSTGPNILSDDTLPPEDDDEEEGGKPVFSQIVQNTLMRSFSWATNEGPLCDEMMRGVNVKIIEANLNRSKPLLPIKIIPAVRKAIFASFLCAEPRLMEPIYMVEVITPHNGEYFVKQVLSKRRGNILNTSSMPGTKLKVITAEVPLIDSFGMEVDMRAKTQGQSFALSFFSRWDLVPGKPLDSSIVLRPLEPSPEFALAREFVVKSRRRRGQSENIDLSKYVGEDQLIEIAALLGNQ